jgi:hypothetical protein
MNRTIILGTTNDITDCECCGRTNLKKTVVLLVDGECVRHYGETCAANALAGWNHFGTVPAGHGWDRPQFPLNRLRALTQKANNERRLAKHLNSRPG